MEMREEKQRRHSDYLMCRYNAVTRDHGALIYRVSIFDSQADFQFTHC